MNKTAAIRCILIATTLLSIASCEFPRGYAKWKCDFITLGPFKYCNLEEGISTPYNDAIPVLFGGYYLSDDSLKLKGNYDKLIEFTKLYLSHKPELYDNSMMFYMSFYNEGRPYEDRDFKFEKEHGLGGFTLKKLKAGSDSLRVTMFGYFTKDGHVADTSGQIIVIKTKVDSIR